MFSADGTSYSSSAQNNTGIPVTTNDSQTPEVILDNKGRVDAIPKREGDKSSGTAKPFENREASGNE